MRQIVPLSSSTVSETEKDGPGTRLGRLQQADAVLGWRARARLSRDPGEPESASAEADAVTPPAFHHCCLAPDYVGARRWDGAARVTEDSGDDRGAVGVPRSGELAWWGA